MAKRQELFLEFNYSQYVRWHHPAWQADLGEKPTPVSGKLQWSPFSEEAALERAWLPLLAKVECSRCQYDGEIPPAPSVWPVDRGPRIKPSRGRFFGARRPVVPARPDRSRRLPSCCEASAGSPVAANQPEPRSPRAYQSIQTGMGREYETPARLWALQCSAGYGRNPLECTPE